MRHIGPDRGISQPGRRPGQHEPGQHISLERRQLTGPGRGTCFTQVSYGRQTQPGPLAFIDPGRSVLETIDPQETRNDLRNQNQPDRRKNPQVQGLDGLKGPQGTLGIFIRKGPGQGHLAGGRLHLTGGDWKRAVTCGTVPVPDPPTYVVRR